jgi:hypothetical protein
MAEEFYPAAGGAVPRVLVEALPETNQAAPMRAACVVERRLDQITGFHAIGTSRYLVPSFSTWPIEGKVKWNPTTIAFSAAAMS